MNKLKILAVACLASAAFAVGDLWNFATLLSDDNCGKFCGQAHTPGAIYCWQETTPKDTNEWGGPCFHGTGGFWYGYSEYGGKVADGDAGTDVAVCEGVVIERYIEPSKAGSAGQNTDWISKTVKGSSAVTAAGHYMIKGYGLGKGDEGFDVKFTGPGGNDEQPNVSGIGFNWRGKDEAPCNPASASTKYPNKDYQGIYTEDLSVKKGLCLVYKADKEAVDIELGWNESAYDYNTWVARLPAASSWTTINVEWSKHFAPSFVSPDNFYPLEEIALKKADALRFVIKNKTSTPETVRFQLKELGWHGSCSGTATEPPAIPDSDKWWENGELPVVGGKVASAYRFNMNGRVLSANFAGTVQVVNLQGKVVAKKVLAANESMNLANLPIGVYMVRSETRGIVQKIMLK